MAKPIPLKLPPHDPRAEQLIDAANAPSLAIHENFGFRKVGSLPEVGFKFGHWTDTVMLQRPLGRGDQSLPSDVSLHS